MILNPAETEDAAQQLAEAAGISVDWGALPEATRASFRRQALGLAAALPQLPFERGGTVRVGPVEFHIGARKPRHCVHRDGLDGLY